MEQPHYFPYGDTETEYLKARDAKLGAVIERIGPINRPVIPDLFEALLNCIVSQQISSKALDTIWGRMQERFSPLTPRHINELSAQALQGCGITMRKALYMKEIANQIENNSLDLDILSTLPDEEVCARLSALPGIGVWTAQMLLIFSLQRPDVLSFGDLAILRGLRMVYHHRAITRALFEKYKRRYSPYATTASLYLWAVAGGAIEGMKDYAPAKK